MPLRFALFFSILIPACRADVIATGTFKSKDSGIQAAGGFEIVSESGKTTLRIKSDFKISDGPDLYFAFHPLASAKVTGDNAKTGALRIAKLKSLTGAQSYDLPADFALDKYPTLIVHCWQYNHLYAAAPVTASAPSTVTRVLPKGSGTSGTGLAKAGFRVLAYDGRRAFDLKGRESVSLPHP